VLEILTIHQNVVCMGKRRDVDGRIILRWSFRKWVYGLDQAGSGYGQVVGTCECSNEPLGSINCGEFLD